MRPGPMWRSRRPWKLIHPVAWLALAIAPACGGSTTAGSRPGSGGSGGGANGGNDAAEVAARARAAARPGAAEATARPAVTARAASSAAAARVGPSPTRGAKGDALGPFDGGTCTDNGGHNTDPPT